MPTYDLGLERVSLEFATKTIFRNVTQGVFEGDRIGIVGKTETENPRFLSFLRVVWTQILAELRVEAD